MCLKKFGACPQPGDLWEDHALRPRRVREAQKERGAPGKSVQPQILGPRRSAELSCAKSPARDQGQRHHCIRAKRTLLCPTQAAQSKKLALKVFPMGTSRLANLRDVIKLRSDGCRGFWRNLVQLELFGGT
eukprot:5006984-Amphidinium_carterae.2